MNIPSHTTVADETLLAPLRQAMQDLQGHMERLGGRAQSFDCLERITRLGCDPGFSLEKFFEQAAQAIPGAFGDPESVRVCITFGNRQYTAGTLSGSARTVQAPLMAGGKRVGALEVELSDAGPGTDDDPATRLTQMIAGQLSGLVARAAMGDVPRGQPWPPGSPGEALCVLDGDLTCVAMSGAFLAVCTFTCEELIGRHASEIFGQEAWEGRLKADLEHCLDGETVQDGPRFDYPRLKTGPVSLSCSPFFSGAQRVCAVGVRLQADPLSMPREGEVDMFLRRLSEFIEFLPDATLVIDRDRRVIACNLAFERLAGVSRDTLVGQGDRVYAELFYGQRRPMLIDLVLEEDETARSLYPGIERSRESLSAEVQVFPRSGEEGAYLWGKAMPLYDPEGNLLGAIETIRDVTEYRLSRAAMKQSEERLHSKTQYLEEVNAALNVLLKKRQEDRREMEEGIQAHVRRLVLPYLERLGASRLDHEQRSLLEVIRTNLDQIVSPYVKRLSERFADLTPMEIRVACLVMEGLSNKEMQDLLCVSSHTITRHRYNIRTKLGLNHSKTNLQVFLRALE